MRRFEQAGRSVAEFCREEGVSGASFYQWRKRLAGAEAREGGEGADDTGSFRPVRLVTAASVAVHLPGGTRLQVPTSDPESLRLVIDTLACVDARRAGGGRC